MDMPTRNGRRLPAAGRYLLPVCLLLGFAACAVNPVTGGREFTLMSEAQEIDIGRQVDVEIRREMGVYDDPALQQYIDEIFQRLARDSHRPNLPWTFAVIDSPAINAFALPGGYIYLTRGILPYLDDEAQLAGVLGHEIGHVTARHSAQAYTRATGAQLGLVLGSIIFPEAAPVAQAAEVGLGVLFLRFSREDELQADRLGVAYATEAGWEPAGVAGMLTTLARIDEATDRRGIPNWLATHPHPADRVERIQPAIQEARAAGGTALATNRDAYLQRIDGIVFGDSPEEGIVRGRAFLHPVLRFALTFPEGWRIANTRTQVVAQPPGANPAILLQLVQQPQGRTMEEVAVASMSQAGFRRLQGSRTSINGLEAHVGIYQGRTQQLGEVVTRAAHVRHDQLVYLLAGLAQPNEYKALEGRFAETIESFRPLSPGEAERIRPNRVDVYVVRAGDTWEGIAQRAGEGVLDATTLAIMNNSRADQPPRAGERIKIVVSG
jgi:predicted Zn-dependent protease